MTTEVQIQEAPVPGARGTAPTTAERVYTTIDKSEWGKGPWQDEPDKVQWTDEATGLPCLAKRHPRHGHWCGYVGVSEGHPAFENNYDDVDYHDVHGGLTYSDHCQDGSEEDAICHVPEPGQPDHVWWLGFDCAHSGDLSPAREADNRRRYAETGDSMWLPYGDETYRPLGYVRRECANLAAQLVSRGTTTTGHPSSPDSEPVA